MLAMLFILYIAIMYITYTVYLIHASNTNSIRGSTICTPPFFIKQSAPAVGASRGYPTRGR